MKGYKLFKPNFKLVFIDSKLYLSEVHIIDERQCLNDNLRGFA